MAACARFESINQVKQEWRRTKVLLRGEPPGRNEQAERQGLPPDLERCRLTTAARQGHPHKAGSKVRPPWSRRASQLHYLCWLDADTATWPSCATPRCPPSSPPPRLRQPETLGGEVSSPRLQTPPATPYSPSSPAAPCCIKCSSHCHLASSGTRDTFSCRLHDHH